MAAPEPITVCASRVAKPGSEAAFEQALHEFVRRSLVEPGQLGVHVMRPAPGSGSREYGIIRKLAARAGVPLPDTSNSNTAACHSHGCAESERKLLGGVARAHQGSTDFWGLGCDCFAF